MNSSNREKAAAASAEFREPELIESGHTGTNQSPTPRTQLDDDTFEESGESGESDDSDIACSDELDVAALSPSPSAHLLVPPEFDLNDFDDEFDDDFEAETAGEYELEDDEYARALLDIVDFEIEGLEAYRDEE